MRPFLRMSVPLRIPRPPLHIRYNHTQPQAHLRENEYASTYEISEDELPPEERHGQIEWDKTRLTFHSDGVLIHRNSQYDPTTYQRLRDNCPCPQCVDPSTRQKLRTSGSSATVKLTKAFKGFDAAGESGAHITWSDSHASFYTEAQLRDMVAFDNGRKNVSHHFRRKLWDRPTLEASNLRMKYEDVRGNAGGMLEMLRQAQVYGLVVVSGVPTERTSDKDCELRAFMEEIGEIRNTFYGQTWDVKSVVNSKNVAYTSQDLGLHMDLLFQALHCLRNRVQGGSSYFADSFYAARHIQHNDPHTASILSRYPLDFEYDNDGHYLRCRHFIMNNLDSLRSHVNWSPPFQGKMRRVAPPRVPVKQAYKAEKEFYEALAKFEETLGRPDVQYEFTMKEGDLVFFDNRRVLHARREYGEGERWLKGCYLDGEVVWDRLATL